MPNAFQGEMRAVGELPKRAIPKAIGKRFLLKGEDGWTTIVRRASRASSKKALPLPPNRARRHHYPVPLPGASIPSKLALLFTRPNTVSTPKLAKPSATKAAMLLTETKRNSVPAEPKNIHAIFPLTNSNHNSNLPSLFKPQPTTLPGALDCSFKKALLKNITMVNNNPQLLAAKAKAKAKPRNSDWRRRGEQLPLPPNPANEAWKGKCFRCLEPGHSRADCTAKVGSCAYCNKDGHETSKCRFLDKLKGAQPDPLEPTGNIGESMMPINRPKSISVVVPQTKDSYKDLRYLQRAIVVDARLWSAHDASGIQARIMAVCCTDETFEISPWDGDRYILILPVKVDRRHFLHQYGEALETFSLVCYPWSHRIGAEPVVYPFKVWLDLHRPPLTAWKFDQLVPMLAQIGLILDHTPLEKVSALDKIRVVLAVKELIKVPLAINYAVRGLGTDIIVSVVGWDFHETAIKVPDDPTPSAAHFQAVQQKLTKQPLVAVQRDTSAMLQPMDVDAVFKWWDKLENDEMKNNLERILRTSPFWAVKEKLDLLKKREKVATGINAVATKFSGAMRGSSSKKPADKAIENQLISSKEFQMSNGQMEIVPAPIVVQPDLTRLQSGREGSYTLDVDSLSSDGKEKEMERTPEAQPMLSPKAAGIKFKEGTFSLGLGSAFEKNEAHNKGKRPADAQSENKNGKRPAERQLTFSPNIVTDVFENQKNNPKAERKRGKNAGKEGKASNGSISLRRSNRLVKDNPKLKSFVTGLKKPSNRKGSLIKLKGDVIKEALAGAKLAKCFNPGGVVAEPLTEEEVNRVKEFCSIIAQEVQPGLETSNREEAQQTSVPETQLQEVEEGAAGETMSGLDDWVPDEYSDLEEEGNPTK